jgi:hypothetical protein
MTVMPPLDDPKEDEFPLWLLALVSVTLAVALLLLPLTLLFSLRN